MNDFERTKRSLVWNFFEKLPSDAKKVKCTLCGCILSRSGKGKSASNTSMNNHVKTKHFAEFSSLQKEKQCPSSPKQAEEQKQISLPSSSTIQLTLKKAFEGKNMKWDINDARAQEIHYSIAEMIAVDGQPLSVVEDMGFKRLMTKLKPHYALPSRKYFSEKVIPDIYERCKRAIASSLKDISDISFTCDIWTCSYTNKSFLSFTAHWLNKDMDFQHAMLNVKYLPGHHSGTAIANLVTTLKEMWDINEKFVHLIIRDGAANISKGCSDAGFKSIHCIIHTIQICIKASLSSQRAVSDMLAVARNIVGHFNHSAFACSTLESIQLELAMKPKKLIQDIATRWNSTYYMLERLQELKRPLTLYATDNDITNFTTAQWQLLENVIKLLSPFEEITTLMSSNESILSEVIPSIKTLLYFLGKESTDHFGCGTMKATLKSEIEKKFPFVKNMNKGIEDRHDNDNIEEEIEDFSHYFIATAIDPRFKESFFTEKYKCQIKKLLKKKAVKLNEFEYDNCAAVDSPPKKKKKYGNVANIGEGNVQNTSGKNSTFWQCFEEITSSQMKPCETDLTAETELEEKVEKEIENFLAGELIIKRTDSPFSWWKKHATKFPILSKVAKKFLSAPSSSAYSEQVFSEAGNIYNDKRNRLSPENVEKLVFLHHNLKYIQFNY